MLCSMSGSRHWGCEVSKGKFTMELAKNALASVDSGLLPFLDALFTWRLCACAKRSALSADSDLDPSTEGRSASRRSVAGTNRSLR